MSNETELAAFLDSVRWERYRGVQYSVAAYDRDGVWLSLGSLFVCCARRSPKGWTHRSTIGNLCVLRGWIPVASARDVLAQLATGEVTLDRKSIRVASTERQQFSWSRQRFVPGTQSAVGWTAQLVTGSGPAIDEVLPGGYEEYDTLRRRLPAASPRPFRDWVALQEFLGFDGPTVGVANRNLTALAIFAPTFARIAATNVDLQLGALEVAVESYESVEDLALVLTPENASLDPVRIPASEWKRRKAGLSSMVVKLEPEMGPIRVQLVGRGEVIDESITGAPPLAVRAHAAIDDECGWLRRFLGLIDNKKVASDAFEVGVAALLNLGGIPAVHYGHKSGNNFPDVIGTIGDDQLLVAECTVDAPTLGKIQTLAARADSIRATAARGIRRHVTVLRVLFTPRQLSEVAPDVRSAAQDALSVAIVTRERIAEMFDDIVRGESQWSVSFKLVNWINTFGSVRS